MGEKKFLEVKSLFSVMCLECTFVKIEVAFVAESYNTLKSKHSNIFSAFQLDARFDATVKPERMLASTGKETVVQKIWGIVGHRCWRHIVISWNCHLRWLLSQ